MIYISAGHSAADSGAIAFDGTAEATLTRQLADAIRDRLISQGVAAAQIMRDAHSINLMQTIREINATPSIRWVLDIHFNHNHPTANGTECFVHDRTSDSNRFLANQFCQTTARVLGTPNRGVKGESQSAVGRLGILHVRPPVILWEVCFLNTHDLGKYRANQAALVNQICDLILNSGHVQIQPR